MLTTPTSRPCSRTGRWRWRSLVIIAMAWATLSSGPTVVTLRVITSLTGISIRPALRVRSALTMSRSETMPRISPARSRTISAPVPVEPSSSTTLPIDCHSSTE